MIKCVIADDEPLAITLLEDHLKQAVGFQLLLGTTDPLQAVQYVQDNTVDLLFLDIEMPRLNGLEVMGIINNRCLVIVTSAYSEYAIHGYDHNIVDYLLKPVTLARFMTALSKVRAQLTGSENNITPDDCIYLKVEQRLQRFNFNEILYFEGARDYISVVSATGKVFALQTMKGIEELLPTNSFVRVHKSFIVSINKIQQIHKHHLVINNTFIPIGEFYQDNFLKRVLNN